MVVVGNKRDLTAREREVSASGGCRWYPLILFGNLNPPPLPLPLHTAHAYPLDGRAYAEQLEYPFIKTSAKMGANVEDAMFVLIGEIQRLRVRIAKSLASAPALPCPLSLRVSFLQPYVLRTRDCT